MHGTRFVIPAFGALSILACAAKAPAQTPAKSDIKVTPEIAKSLGVDVKAALNSFEIVPGAPFRDLHGPFSAYSVAFQDVKTYEVGYYMPADEGEQPETGIVRLYTGSTPGTPGNANIRIDVANTDRLLGFVCSVGDPQLEVRQNVEGIGYSQQLGVTEHFDDAGRPLISFLTLPPRNAADGVAAHVDIMINFKPSGAVPREGETWTFRKCLVLETN